MEKEKANQFTIRPLTDEDLFVVLDLFSTCAQKVQSDIIQLAQGKGNAVEGGMKLFMTLFTTLSGQEKDKIRKFLSSLIGVSLEEYKKMPFNTTIDLIKELKDNDDIKKLFATVSGIFSTQKA